MPAGAASVAEYLASLPPDRRAALARVRAAVNDRLPRGYEEILQYGMISWVVPASRLSHTYNGQALALASLGAQKHHMALYLMCIDGDAARRTWFEAAFRASGKQLDMGKACVRFQAAEDLPLDVIGEAIARVPVDAYIASYEANRSRSVKPKPVATQRAAKVAAATKRTPAQAAAKRTPARAATKRTPAQAAAMRTRAATKQTPARVAAKRTPARVAKRAARA